MAPVNPKATPGGKSLIDHYGRKLHYLRISLTDRCNLRCIYCMPQKGVAKLAHREVLSLEEMARVARLAVGMGVDKIRLTGGEPLLRRNIEALLKELNALRPRPDLRVTTNALLLADKMPVLKKYGVSTVNISLDTLKPERYGRIVGLKDEFARNAFRKVWKGIETALADGEMKVKLNVVALYGVNDDEIVDFARLTEKMKLAVRFIEYMPVGRHKPFEPEKFLAAKDILEALSGLGPHRKPAQPARRRPGPALPPERHPGRAGGHKLPIQPFLRCLQPAEAHRRRPPGALLVLRKQPEPAQGASKQRHGRGGSRSAFGRGRRQAQRPHQDSLPRRRIRLPNVPIGRLDGIFHDAGSWKGVFQPMIETFFKTNHAFPVALGHPSRRGPWQTNADRAAESMPRHESGRAQSMRPKGEAGPTGFMKCAG